MKPGSWRQSNGTGEAAAAERAAAAIREELARDQELRWEIFERDGYRCIECGAKYDLTIDHIVPVSDGGNNDPSNLRTLCRSCNSRKGPRASFQRDTEEELKAKLARWRRTAMDLVSSLPGAVWMLYWLAQKAPRHEVNSQFIRELEAEARRLAIRAYDTMAVEDDQLLSRYREDPDLIVRILDELREIAELLTAESSRLKAAWAQAESGRAAQALAD